MTTGHKSFNLRGHVPKRLETAALSSVSYVRLLGLDIKKRLKA